MSLRQFFKPGKVWSCGNCRILGLKPKYSKRWGRRPLCPYCGGTLGYQIVGTTDMKTRRMKEAEERNPNAPRQNLHVDYTRLRSEVEGLRAENANLRPLKAKAATLRAKMADHFYAISEK